MITVTKTDQGVEMREDSGEFGEQEPFRGNCVSFRTFVEDVKEGKYDNLV